MKDGETSMMDTEALQAFLAKPNDAIVAVNRAGKGAQLTPLWFLWMESISSFQRRKGLRNMPISSVIPTSL
jgi:hypothetical protein